MENQQQNRYTQGIPKTDKQEVESSVSLRDIVFLVINNWYWFIAFLFIFHFW